MTEEQIQAVKQSEEPEEAAMVFVRNGEATSIEFSRHHIIGECGKKRRNLEQSGADEAGGWENVAGLINWESIAGSLLCADGPIIVPGEMKDESVVSFIDQMQCALAAVIRNEDDTEKDFSLMEEDLEE